MRRPVRTSCSCFPFTIILVHFRGERQNSDHLKISLNLNEFLYEIIHHVCLPSHYNSVLLQPRFNSNFIAVTVGFKISLLRMHSSSLSPMSVVFFSSLLCDMGKISPLGKNCVY